eukprot:scaffold34725_cov30-Tisochrysis_lutea.AAC.2
MSERTRGNQARVPSAVSSKGSTRRRRKGSSEIGSQSVSRRHQKGLLRSSPARVCASETRFSDIGFSALLPALSPRRAAWSEAPRRGDVLASTQLHSASTKPPVFSTEYFFRLSTRYMPWIICYPPGATN